MGSNFRVKKSAAAFLLLLAGTISGCYLNGHLFPVRGPLASMTPPPTLSARVSGEFNSGNMSVTLPDGEICKGQLSTVSQNPAQNNGHQGASLASAWDSVYGQGFYTAHILGAKLLLRGRLTGNNGAFLVVELYRPVTPKGVGEVKGVGSDNSGNIFKIGF